MKENSFQVQYSTLSNPGDRSKQPYMTNNYMKKPLNYNTSASILVCVAKIISTLSTLYR